MRRKTGRRARRKPVTSVLSNKKPLFSDHVSLYSPDFKSHLSHGQGDRRDHGYRDILPIPGISNDDRTPWFLVPIHHHLTGDPPFCPSPLLTWEPWSDKLFKEGALQEGQKWVEIHFLFTFITNLRFLHDGVDGLPGRRSQSRRNSSLRSRS